MADGGLIAIAIAASVVEVGCREARVVLVHEGIGAIVEAFPRDGHIVGIEHRVAKAHRHPLSDQFCRALH